MSLSDPSYLKIGPIQWTAAALHAGTGNGNIMACVILL
jgi:hypothetical protein